MMDKFPLPEESEKEKAVQNMFSSAARKYDLTNTLLSFGLHHYWKRITASSVSPLGSDDRVLDLCAGTADLSIILARRFLCQVVAVDLNEEMLTVGKQKVIAAGLSDRITLVRGNAELLEFADNSFNAVTVAFGIRNVTNMEKAFAEILRVLVPGGGLYCLDFSSPRMPFLRRIYDCYSFYLLPVMGERFSGKHFGIYRYLPSSIRAFPQDEEMKKILEAVGFQDVAYRSLSGGIATLYTGKK